ncbi:MAG: citramalate synthase [Ruminococcaceae bacterium]|nr:citramalate synthase [Oscillospiraceae bacterium]
MKNISIFDSTLRDGAQGENISFSADDKLKILQRLDSFGVTFVEAGNPGSNPKDLDFFKRAKALTLKNTKLVAFGSTRRKTLTCEEDENLNALLTAETKYVSIFGKSWKLHSDIILGATPEENFAMIGDTVAYLVSKGKKVIFDAEHFFDGCKDDPDFALSALKAAEKAGASAVVLCDTNGGCFPDEVEEITKKAVETVHIPVGIHCHNDIGCAVACSIAAVKAGAAHVQGTFIGIGERCGNANLSVIIPNLQLKLGYDCVPEKSLEDLTPTAFYIAEIANTKLPGSAPYVGRSAFGHKGGMHVDGVAKDPKTFEHISPESVGNERSFLLSEVSGRSTVLSKLISFDKSLDKNSPETKRIMEKLKKLENAGFQFEAAGASFELMVLKELKRFKPFFNIEHFHVVSSQNYNTFGLEKANAMVKVKVGDKYEITADEGDGPVNAIDRAIRKALEVFYPQLKRTHLIDYKVRVIAKGDSTAAVTRVLIESTDGEKIWTTVGASKDVIDASLIALLDAINYYLYHKVGKAEKNQ